MAETNPTLLEEILQLDAAGNLPGVMTAVTSRPFHLPEVLLVLQALLNRGRLRSGLVVAMLLTKNGFKHWTISLALAFGGLVYRREEEEALGMAQLQEQMDGLDVTQQDLVHQQVVSPLQELLVEQHLVDKTGESIPPVEHLNSSMARMVEIHLRNKAQSLESRPLNDEEWWRILAMCRAAHPLYRKLFDMQAPIPRYTLKNLQKAGRARADLLRYPLPDPSLPKQRRRVMIFIRDFYIPRRIKVGMERYGWDVLYHGTISWQMTEEDIREVLQQCRQQQTELLLLHFDQVVGVRHMKPIYEMLLVLRRELPHIKLVVTTCDIWGLRKDTLEGAPDPQINNFARQFIALFDAIWASDSPSLPTVKNDPLFAERILNLHVPHAGFDAAPDRPLRLPMLYIGSEVEKRLTRKFYLLACERYGLPVERKDHFFIPDKNLAPLELWVPEGSESLATYGQHMRRLQEATCCLHFSRGPEPRTLNHGIVTHRSFEVPMSGALLIQEYATDMSRYFIPGEHYLEFNSVAELAGIAQFIIKRPEEAEEIRRAGNAFAREHYSDEKIIGYLEQFLWPQGS
ncbi:glycosyltransferase [Candidatus Magnetaquicoccus inordinatus]|uniref:glycosyltransferase family protein n=1 Tax=Candidatus Magnetaquicoccus inordinatus TaxID=2496818 RepID=UPI00102B14CA|nr:glycosyltransferase [Candidatus Magnetaquicoccus inordinatus]